MKNYMIDVVATMRFSIDANSPSAAKKKLEKAILRDVATSLGSHRQFRNRTVIYSTDTDINSIQIDESATIE